MAEPEIDEAAAVEWAKLWVSDAPVYTLVGADVVNLARAALRWKARAEAAEAERDKWEFRADSLEAELERLSDPCPDCGHPLTVDEVGEFDGGAMRCEVCLPARQGALCRGRAGQPEAAVGAVGEGAMTRKAAAQALGISERTLYRYIRAISALRPCDLEAELPTIRLALSMGGSPKWIRIFAERLPAA